MTQLHDACERGDLEQVTFLLSNEECDINARNTHGDQPLHIACKNADLEIVKVLLKDQKCYLNTRNKDGDTPLHLACHNKMLPIVRLLLEQKCSTYIRNKKGEIAQRITLNENGDCLLHIACRWESIDIVRNLINTERCDLNFRNGDLNTPLHIACYQKSLQIIRLFLEGRCNTSIPNKEGVIAQSIPLNEYGDCLLHIACQWGDVDIVKYLISDQKCNLNITNINWNTPLHIACFEKSFTIIKLFLEMKCKVNLSNKKGEMVQYIPLTEDGDCLLHIACWWGDVDIVRYLIMDEKCDLNIQNGTSNSPLHIACYWKSLDIIKLLLEVKCNTKISNRKGKSAHDIPLNDNGDLLLHVACQWGDVDIVRYLAIDQKCDINIQNVDLNTPLHFACYQKSLTIIKLLLEMRCSTDIPNKKGETAQDIPLNEDGDCLIHIACQWGNVDIVNYLITDGRCNVCDQSYTSKNTPLHIAVLYDQDDITDQLIATKQCDLNIQNRDSETPLHIAVRQVQDDTIIQLLSLQNCNPDLKNNEGNTPLHIACYKKSLHIIRQLLERSCSIQLLNKKGETAQDIPLNEDGDYLLHIACQWGDVDIVRYLITEGCKPTAQSYSSKNTPLHVAVADGQNMIIKLLLCKECDLSIQNKYGDTPLHTASRLNQTAAISQLLAHPQCNINVQNKDGDTALHVAVNVSKTVPVSHPKYDLHIEIEELFHTAVLYSQDDTIIQLLSCKECDVNIENKQGDTPLHIAVRQSKTTAITQLLAHRQCNINCQNGGGITPLHIAAMQGQDDTIVQLLSYKDCDLNVQNKEGDTPLHSAVRQNSTSAIYKLLSHQQCNANITNKAGYTPLHIAVRYGEDNTAVQLLSFRECDPNIQNVEGDTPLHTATRENRGFIVTQLLANKQCNPNVQNANDDTPLHIAVRENRIPLPIISHFLDDANCDMNILNSDHLTPLLIAIKRNNSSVATTLLEQKKCNPLLCDPYKNTSLHFACRSAETNQEMVRVAKQLLTTVDPMCVNNAGQTPIELTTNYQLIQAISHIVKCKTKQSVQTYINMFIVGNPETGKSTLVRAVCKEATSILWKIVPSRFRRVKDVPIHTAGIIPTTFQSKTFGNVVLYDLAGQVEYYTSHAAVIQSTVISTPPGFIVVVNLSESEEKIVQTLRYWWSFIDNHAVRSSAPPQVILVGSHADVVKSTGRSVQEKMTQITDILKKLSTSFYFAGQVALDCRDPASKKLQLFCSLVNQSCTVLRKTADVDLRCHVLYAFLLERFKGKIACTVSDIATSVKENRELLPQNSDSLIPLISTLSDKGLLLLVKGAEVHADWWIILQKQALLGEVNGIIFAPKGFRQYKDLSWSTGVVPFSKLRNEFLAYNSNMITKFLTHLEFCFKIEDHQTLALLKEEAATVEDTSTDVSEDYYFFPALVSVENPLHVWEENDDMCCKCGWFYQCIQHDQFLTTQFLHVLILRLAFTFALKLDPGDCREDSLSLCRKCSVWKHGIAWVNRVRIETVVEVGLQYQSVILMMRCSKGKEAKCAQLRSEVIQKVLEAKDEHCKAVKMSESFIHPTNVKYPFTENTEDVNFYSLTEIARGIICKGEEANALDHSGRNPIPVQDLLLFDPYTTNNSTELLRDLFSEKHSMDEKVRKQVLESLNSAPSPAVKSEVTHSENTSKPRFANSERGSIINQCDPVTLHVLRTGEATKIAVRLFARQVVVILHTCSVNEYWAALELLEPPTAEDGSKIRDRSIIYPHVGSVIGWFAGYRTAVVRTGLGNKCRDELKKVLILSFPNGKVVIGAGIAYASNRERKFADVLISDQIENFVQYKIVDGKITNRGPHEQIDPNVQRVFENPARDWTDMKNFICTDDNRTSVAHIGCVASAPTLVQDEVLRDQLIKHTPDCIGGEMEGWVLLELKRTLKSQYSKDIEVIVIKGVAGYSDCTKGDQWEWTAAKAAMNCIHYCLNKSGGIEFSAIHKPAAMIKDVQPEATSNTVIKPTLPELLKFKCTDERVINISVEIATKYVSFGAFLLDDKTGSRVKIMAHKHLNDAERINTEILQEWLTEKGKQPVTWTTLVEVLRDIELTALASEIEAVKCPQPHAVSVGQFHVATSHATEK